MVDENRAEIKNAQPRDVAILARKFGEILQRIVIERPERPSFEPFGRAGRKLFAARAPHLMMLCLRPRSVNAARQGRRHISRERSARIRKPPRRKPPVPLKILHSSTSQTPTPVSRVQTCCVCAPLCAATHPESQTQGILRLVEAPAKFLQRRDPAPRRNAGDEA